MPMTTPFPTGSSSTRPGIVARWRASAGYWTGRTPVFEEFSGWFNGKTSPVHLFWHSLDLAVSPFSGRPGARLDADPVTQEAYSREVISFGFWAGDDNVGDAAYYSYTAPEPDGLRDQPLSAGEWIEFGAGSLAILRYDHGAHGARSRAGVARVPAERLRGRCPSRRLGHRGLRVRHGVPARALQQLQASAAATFGLEPA